MKSLAIKKALTLMLCVVLTFAFCSCAPAAQVQATQAPADTAAATSAPTDTATAEPEADLPSLPLEENITIQVFATFNAKYVGLIENYADMPFYKWLAEKANITWDFINPSSEIGSEQFAMMIASKDLPDVIEGIGGYDGGDTQAYLDGIIIDLKPIMNEGYMPNMTQFMTTFPEYNQYIEKTTGELLSFPHIRGFAESLNSNGLVVRKDLLDAAGIAIPETIDEWDTALRALKAAGVIPFSPRSSAWLNQNMPFISAWGMTYFEYNDNGTVKYGAVQPEFKEYLTVMNKWYQDGLLDPDYLTADSKSLTSKVSAGLVGSFIGACNGNLKTPWYALAEENVDSTVEYAAAPVPVLNKGDTPVIGPRYAQVTANAGMYITSQCENPEKVALVFDEIYSEEASYILNYGIEGENYNLDGDGRINPYTIAADGTITDMSASWSPKRDATPSAYVQGLISYTNGKIYSPSSEEVLVPMPLGDNPDQLTLKKQYIDGVCNDALALWSSFDAVNLMPTLVYTTEETTQRSEVYGDLETFIFEEVTSFIIGTRSLDEFDAFVSEVYEMGVEDAMAIAQATLDKTLGK